MVRRLLLLNGLAVIGAVVNHASGWGFTAMFWWTDRYQPVPVPDFGQLGSLGYFALRAFEQLIMFSLPAFMFVSGFFAATSAGQQRVLGWEKVGARLRVLLIPYLVWSLGLFAGRAVEGVVDTPEGYLAQLAFGRAAEPYYYVPLLTQLFLLAPLLVRTLAVSWMPLLAAAALQLGVQAARYPVLLGMDAPLAEWIVRHTPGWTFPHLVFWFAFGVFAAFHLDRVGGWARRWRPVLPVVTVALFAAGLVEWEVIFSRSGQQWITPTPTVVDTLYALAFVMTFMAFADRLPASPWLDTLGVRSYGVYLLHAPVLELVARATYHVAPSLLAHQVTFTMLLVAAGIGVPLAAMALVNRSPARPAYKFVFG